MEQNKQLARHVDILQQLDTVVGVTIQELMELTHKNRRTVERDLKRDFHCPVSQLMGRIVGNSCWSLRKN
jgi:predicted DNA-binding transcriptional regulator YafY